MPLRHPLQMVEIESTAVAGGGRPLGAGLMASPGASPAMLAGEELYIGGQLGVTADGSLPADAEQQTRTAWTRVQALLAAGADQAGGERRGQDQGAARTEKATDEHPPREPGCT